MDDYIRREAALKAFEPQCGDWSECWSAEEIKPKLESIPAADVAPVRHGRWMDSKEDGHPSICCVCNYPVDRFYKTKYCPNCGAKMTEV